MVEIKCKKNIVTCQRYWCGNHVPRCHRSCGGVSQIICLENKSIHWCRWKFRTNRDVNIALQCFDVCVSSYLSCAQQGNSWLLLMMTYYVRQREYALSNEVKYMRTAQRNPVRGTRQPFILLQQSPQNIWTTPGGRNDLLFPQRVHMCGHAFS